MWAAEIRRSRGNSVVYHELREEDVKDGGGQVVSREPLRTFRSAGLS